MVRKTAIIVGGSSEIGFAVAKKIFKSGKDLALTYNSNKKEIDNFMKDKKEGTKVEAYKLDLTQKDEIEKVFSQIEDEFPYIDTLIFCAGVAQKRALIMDTTNSEIDNLFDVNIKSSIKCVREFVKMTVNKHPANIVLVGSFVEKFGCSCESVYTATKSALTGLCKSLANELGNLDVRINVVAPGFIDTKMNNNLTTEEKDDIAEMTPLKRLGTAEDVANCVAFLSSDDASFVTGQTLFVDGGLILE